MMPSESSITRPSRKLTADRSILQQYSVLQNCLKFFRKQIKTQDQGYLVSPQHVCVHIHQN